MEKYVKIISYNVQMIFNGFNHINNFTCDEESILMG